MSRDCGPNPDSTRFQRHAVVSGRQTEQAVDARDPALNARFDVVDAVVLDCLKRFDAAEGRDDGARARNARSAVPESLPYQIDRNCPIGTDIRQAARLASQERVMTKEPSKA